MALSPYCKDMLSNTVGVDNNSSMYSFQESMIMSPFKVY